MSMPWKMPTLQKSTNPRTRVESRHNTHWSNSENITTFANHQNSSGVESDRPKIKLCLKSHNIIIVLTLGPSYRWQTAHSNDELRSSLHVKIMPRVSDSLLRLCAPEYYNSECYNSECQILLKQSSLQLTHKLQVVSVIARRFAKFVTTTVYMASDMRMMWSVSRALDKMLVLSVNRCHYTNSPQDADLKH